MKVVSRGDEVGDHEGEGKSSSRLKGMERRGRGHCWRRRGMSSVDRGGSHVAKQTYRA